MILPDRAGVVLRHRRLIVDLIHATLAAVAFAASFLLRFEFALAPPYTRMLAVSLPLAAAAKLTVFRAFGLRDLAWRYLGFADLLRIAASNVAASAAAAVRTIKPRPAKLQMSNRSDLSNPPTPTNRSMLVFMLRA